mmetsp:Transcript_22998/g.22161  ORF Transcript_22998/g.22161 Transcript_22998/m.22161 type:complete len:358 (-) Transcript_22998:466-1539(-)
MGAGASITDENKSKILEGNEAPLPVFTVALHTDNPSISSFNIPKIFKIRANIESVDFLHKDSEALIAQFPYQDISSWGSSVTLFQFTVFNYIKRNEKTNEEKKYSELETRIDDALNGTDSISIDTLSDKVDPNRSVKKDSTPIKSILGTTKPVDVLIIKNKNGHVIENINKSDRSANIQNRSVGHQNGSFMGDDIIVKIKTVQAMAIEEATMAAVRKLMNTIEKSGMPKIEFDSLIENLIDTSDSSVKSNWRELILESSQRKAFMAKQAIDLVMHVTPYLPFEKFDLACLVYTRMLNKDSFQLIVNSFQDVKDRENLVYRLKLDLKKGDHEFLSTCSMLPTGSGPGAGLGRVPLSVS